MPPHSVNRWPAQRRRDSVNEPGRRQTSETKAEKCILQRTPFLAVIFSLENIVRVRTLPVRVFPIAYSYCKTRERDSRSTLMLVSKSVERRALFAVPHRALLTNPGNTWGECPIIARPNHSTRIWHCLKIPQEKNTYLERTSFLTSSSKIYSCWNLFLELGIITIWFSNFQLFW